MVGWPSIAMGDFVAGDNIGIPAEGCKPFVIRNYNFATLSHCIIIPENLIDRRRLAMSSLDKMLGWFPHSSTEWLELIIVALLLWLLMMVAISALELSSIS